MDNNGLADTGERLISDADCQNAVEHLHRYALALDFVKDADVLDIACGSGYGSNLLAQASKTVVGVDISPQAIEHARTRYQQSNLRYVEGAADSIPLDSATVDVVVSFETLEHHDKHEAFLAEIRRVLRSNGLLIMSTPDRRWYSDEPRLKNKYHVKELYSSEFRELIEARFANVVFASQDLFFGSIVMPDVDALRQFSLWGGEMASVERMDEMPRARFRICFASDSPIKPLGASAFDGRRGLQDIRQYVLHLKRRILALEKVNQELERSASHKLGRVLTSPFRWLGRRK